MNSTNNNFKHVGGKNLNDARMLLKLQLADPAAVGILESALLHDPRAVELMIDKAGLGDVPGHDPRWMALLSSLHTLGNYYVRGDAKYPLPFFAHWWGQHYSHFSEAELEDLTVFGSSTHASVFDGQRNFHIDTTTDRAMSLRAEMKAVRRSLAREGFTATKTGGGHWRFANPRMDGAVFAADTPSDRRTIRNLRALIRRKMRLSTHTPRD